MGEFDYIENGYQGSLVIREAPKTISIPDRKYENDDPEDRASAAVREVFATETIGTGLKAHVLRITEPESIENLMSGTVNLINTIIENNRQGKPIDTMLFLDKSARNGAYVLRLLWQELQNRGEIPEGVVFPKTRFMNIGRFDDGKHHNIAPLELLKVKYKKNDFEGGRVVVVDEYVATGGSLRRALKTIEDTFGTVPVGLAQFEKLPSWYGSKGMGLLGVTDLEDAGGRYSLVKKGLDKLTSEEARSLFEIASRTDKREFAAIISKVTYWTNKNIRPGIIHKFLATHGKNLLHEEDIESLHTIAKESEMNFIDGTDVWQYINSAGGFTSSRMDGKEQNENNRYYRQTLRAIVSSYMMERDIDGMIPVDSATI